MLFRSQVPFGVYPARDGHVAIVAMMPEWFRGLMEAMGHPELITDPRFSERGPRMRHATAMNQLVEAWTKTRTCGEILAELHDKRRIPCAKVRTAEEVLQDPALRERGAVLDLAHPTHGPTGATGMGLPIQFSACHAQFDEAAPVLGSANDAVYGELLGLSKEEIAALKADGVI